MLINKVLYNKIMNIFASLFNDIIEDRSHEEEFYNIQVLHVEDSQSVLKICFYEFDEVFVVLCDHESERINIWSFKDDESYVDCDSNFGMRVTHELERMLFDSLIYFKENYEFKVKFENVDALDFELKEVSGQIKQELGDGKSIQLNKSSIINLNKYKRVSVDLGIGKIIKYLNKQGIITMNSCFGHPRNAYLSLYCFDSELDKITNYIVSKFKNAKLDDDKKDQLWQPTEDGRKCRVFRW